MGSVESSIELSREAEQSKRGKLSLRSPGGSTRCAL